MQRSTSERLFQAVIYELIAIAFLTPVYSWAFDMPFDNSLGTMAMISIGVIVWAAIYNTIFDRIMFARTGRLGHDKTTGLRVLHATLLEVTITLIAVPIIMIMSGVSIWIALVADIAFSVIFAIYTYIFYFIYDRLRPVPSAAQRSI
tara:strand:- start:5410 stop:5850 length:441 start_codon:yes stop_codon:yes gene_type:complete